MRLTNDLDLPAAIVNAIANDPYDDAGADITVTRLIAPPQMVELTRRHDAELVEDVSQRLWALMGQAMHAILERAHDSAVQEERLCTEVRGWTVSGKFDRFHMESGTLQDYKFASVWEAVNGVHFERQAQLNVLAELCRRNGYSVERVEVVYLFRDWSPTKAKSGGNYPQRQMAVVPVPLWTPQQAAEYLEERVRLHQAAREGDIMECSPEDRWARPDQWAVMKQGRKSAVKLHSDPKKAEAHVLLAGGEDAGYYVQERPGESVRCEGYCLAAPFCPQYARLQEEQQ